MAQVLSVINGKGGVGKSSLTAHTSGLYALAGNRVLTIDLDPQGNLAEAYGLVGVPGVDDQGAALAEALLAGRPVQPQPASRPGVDRSGLYAIGGGPALGDVYVRMLRTFDDDARPDTTALAHATAFWLRNSLAPVLDDFDLVVIDCPPGIEQLQVLALTASNFALFPVGADLSERKGVRLIADVFAKVRDTTNPDLDLAGIVAMRIKRSQVRTALHELRSRVAADFGGNGQVLFNAWVAEAAAAAIQARARGLLVHELDEQARTATQTRIADLRRGARPSTQPIASSVTGLASDYTDVAVELSERMTLLAAGGTLEELADTRDSA